MNKIEILAPAGGFDSVIAAVRSGADAVYLGAKNFSARCAAQNFSLDELAQAVSYCHIRGVRVYLAVNTLITDRELPDALRLVTDAAGLGTDAVILQDFGFSELVHKAVPELAMHASTQMSVHTPAGAQALYEAGFKRAVLARELSKSEIEQIRAASPIELEVFVHGALCMSVSGQCYFSSMLGTRSGNRGACAQPCRLPFKIKNSNGYALSLKDNSIIDRIAELNAMGVNSAKIEGRMKRPEYVAAAVNACVQARSSGAVTPENAKRLADVFSRTGFTDGYYTGRRGRNMFGFRRKDDVTAASEKLFSKIRSEYKDETPHVGVNLRLYARKSEKVSLTVSDGTRSLTVYSEEAAAPAEKRPLNAEFCAGQLSKTGGTPYFVKSITADIDSLCAVSASTLNALRRAAFKQLSEQRAAVNAYRTEEIKIPRAADFTRRLTEFEKRLRVVDCRYLPIFDDFDRIMVPLFSNPEELSRLAERGLSLAVEIPRCMFGAEEQVVKRLARAREMGITHAVVHNIGAIPLAKSAGFTLHGGFGLNIVNTASVLWAEKVGLADVELSFELSLKQIEHIGGNLPKGITSYGRLPLMITRCCPNKNAGVRCASCSGRGALTDRKNISFPFMCDGITTQIYNSAVLMLSENLKSRGTVDFEIYSLTFEKGIENIMTSSQLLQKTAAEPRITNGLYYRGMK